MILICKQLSDVNTKSAHNQLNPGTAQIPYPLKPVFYKGISENVCVLCTKHKYLHNNNMEDFIMLNLIKFIIRIIIIIIYD